MLTPPTSRFRRRVSVVLAALIGAGIVFVPSAAFAELCEVKSGDSITLVDCDTINGSDSEDEETGGPSEPSCEIDTAGGDNACYKGESCLINDPAANSAEDVADELGPKPGDDYHPAFRSCGADYLWYWSNDEGPSIEDLALQAFGELPFPTFTPTFNPPRRTLVNLPTWWWADGASTTDLTASAGSVTVTADPNRMQVDPGDGSDLVVCQFTTSRSDECTHTYRRSKATGYTARIRLVWDISFTDDDAPVTLDGLPTEFTSPWNDVNVPVREVQTRVVPR